MWCTQNSLKWYNSFWLKQLNEQYGWKSEISIDTHCQSINVYITKIVYTFVRSQSLTYSPSPPLTHSYFFVVSLIVESVTNFFLWVCIYICVLIPLALLLLLSFYLHVFFRHICIYVYLLCLYIVNTTKTIWTLFGSSQKLLNSFEAKRRNFLTRGHDIGQLLMKIRYVCVFLLCVCVCVCFFINFLLLCFMCINNNQFGVSFSIIIVIIIMCSRYFFIVIRPFSNTLLTLTYWTYIVRLNRFD